MDIFLDLDVCLSLDITNKIDNKQDSATDMKQQNIMSSLRSFRSLSIFPNNEVCGIEDIPNLDRIKLLPESLFDRSSAPPTGRPRTKWTEHLLKGIGLPLTIISDVLISIHLTNLDGTLQ